MTNDKRSTKSELRSSRAHLGTTTGARLCPKDQPQRVRMPTGVEIIPNRVAAVPLRLVLGTQPRSVSSRFLVVVEDAPKAAWRRHTFTARTGVKSKDRITGREAQEL